MPETTQPPNGHGSQLLPRLQAIDLRAVESQTRHGHVAQSSSQIPSPVVFFPAPAPLGLAIGIIFNGPAGAVGLQSGKAMLPSARGHRGPGSFLGRVTWTCLAFNTAQVYRLQA